MSKYIDQLTEDPVISNQLWVCISFLSPETITNCSLRAIKIRGVFNTREEADKRAKFLREIDPDFNIYIGEVGKWLPLDPDPDTVEDHVYHEEKLQDMMDNYKKNREKAKILEEKRKRDILEESIKKEANKNKTKNNKDNKDNDLDKKIKEIEDNHFKSGPITTDNEQVKEPVISQETTDISTIDDKLNKLQAHYKLLMDKKNKKQKTKVI